MSETQLTDGQRDDGNDTTPRTMRKMHEDGGCRLLKITNGKCFKEQLHGLCMSYESHIPHLSTHELSRNRKFVTHPEPEHKC